MRLLGRMHARLNQFQSDGGSRVATTKTAKWTNLLWENVSCFGMVTLVFQSTAHNLTKCTRPFIVAAISTQRGQPALHSESHTLYTELLHSTWTHHEEGAEVHASQEAVLHLGDLEEHTEQLPLLLQAGEK